MSDVKGVVCTQVPKIRSCSPIRVCVCVCLCVLLYFVSNSFCIDGRSHSMSTRPTRAAAGFDVLFSTVL